MSNKILQPENAFLQEAINRVTSRLMSKASTGRGLEQVPRLGIYSLMLEYTPMIVYDHPVLAKMCDTAFTDGQRIYWHAPFLAKLMLEDQKAKEEKTGETSLLPILLHELTHIALNHVKRTPSLRLVTEGDSDDDSHGVVRRAVLSNEDIFFSKLAKEYAVNAIVTATLRDLRNQFRNPKSYLPGESFKQGVGTKEEDCDKYFGLAEPHIEVLLRQEMLEQYRQQQGGQGGSADLGDPQSEEESAGDGTPSSSSKDSRNHGGHRNASSKNKAGRPKKSQNPENEVLNESSLGLDDEIRPEDVARVLEKAGLDDVREELDIPKSEDQKGHDSKKGLAQDRVLSSQDKMRQIRASIDGADKIPGAHLEDAIDRSLAIDSRGKLSWRAALRSAVVGDGMRYAYTEEVLSPEYYLDPQSLGLGHAPYDGLLVPGGAQDVVAVIVDTSGSMGDGPGLLQELGREVKGLAEDLARQVRIAVIPADTAVRGEIVEMDPMEMEGFQDLPTSGGGGTDFASAINQVVEHYTQKGSSHGRLSHIVYMTDLGDYPPARDEFPSVMPRVTFVTTPECMNENFAQAVSEWADVVMIEDSKEIEIAYQEEASEGGPVMRTG